jgi:signal transduction histidine kinase
VLDNAIKFAPVKSTVAISLTSGDGHATLRIIDDGPGFSQSDADRAFVRFYRGDAGRGTIGRGAGLGLAIAKWIVDGHGGTIRIESVRGKGATVIINLPLAGDIAADMT